MKQTFHRLRRVEIEQYEECRYHLHPGSPDGKRTTVDNVEAFEVVHGEAAAQLEANMSPDRLDPFHEYLVLYLANGQTVTYRNSYVDLFAI